MCDIDWGVSPNEFVYRNNASNAFFNDDQSKKLAVKKQLACALKANNPTLRVKRRKYETSAKKKCKLSAEEMLICVVNFLRTKNQNDPQVLATKSSLQILQKDPVNMTQGFLQNVLGVKSSSSDALLDFISPNCVFESMSLSSLTDRATAKKNEISRVSSWSQAVGGGPKNEPEPCFPYKHDGILKINTASRKFATALIDLLSPEVFHRGNVYFEVALSLESAVISKVGGKLAAPFTWKSIGMTKLGCTSELEFNGLVLITYFVNYFQL